MKNEELSSYVLVDNWRRVYPVITRAEGIYIYDSTGKRYIDALGGFHVVSIGHGVSDIATAIANQTRTVAFINNRVFTTGIQEQLAQRVIELAPKGMARVYFVSGGSEANEIALQIAYQYHRERGHATKHRVISRWYSYHGSTVGSASMTGQLSRRRQMAPYLLNFPHIQPPYCYHCPFGITYPECQLACAKDLARTIEEEDPDSIAAFIAEPIIGTTGGAIVPPPGYYETIRQICDKYDILFIADEVVTGFGRTGLNFGIEHWQAVPDIITSAKGLSSGYAPIGAVIVNEHIWETFTRGKHDSLSLRLTYSGNPISCAAALAVQDYITRHNLIQRCAQMGAYLKAKLEQLAEGNPFIGDIRGRGLLIGVEFISNRETRSPFPRSMKFQERVIESALDLGLILAGGSGMSIRPDGDHITISPPFVITEDECDELVKCFEDSLKAACAQMYNA
jgi:adenosylmethionine-8-amino-7-oxononanoate aminotransferase